MSGNPEPHASTAAYDADAALYAATFPTTEPEQAIDLAVIEHWITVLLTRSPGPGVLDAGCGAGRMGGYITDRGCHTVGVDASTRMIEMARRDHPGLESRVGSILELPFDDDVFDGALYWYSLIHLSESELPRAVAEAHRVLKPGGVALFAFQSGRGVRDVAAGSRGRGHDVTLLRYHRSPGILGEALGAASFDEVLRLERGPCGAEKDPQAFIIARKTVE